MNDKISPEIIKATHKIMDFVWKKNQFSSISQVHTFSIFIHFVNYVHAYTKLISWNLKHLLGLSKSLEFDFYWLCY